MITSTRSEPYQAIMAYQFFFQTYLTFPGLFLAIDMYANTQLKAGLEITRVVLLILSVVVSTDMYRINNYKLHNKSFHSL